MGGSPEEEHKENTYFSKTRGTGRAPIMRRCISGREITCYRGTMQGSARFSTIGIVKGMGKRT